MTPTTPGPWFPGADHKSFNSLEADSSVYPTVTKGNGEIIARLKYVRDAKVMAASLDLLDALKKLRNEVLGAIGIGISDSIGHTNAKVLGDRCQEAFAAIEKAEGR